MTVKTDITDSLLSIHQRLTQLEAVNAIKTLKATYLMACDTKDPALMRDCFVDGELVIDYGPVGQFNHREQLVEIFTEIGCHSHMLESHHGHNPIIELIDDHYAKGSWELAYQVLNSREKTLTQIAMIYRDEYRCVNGEWKISMTVTQTLSTLVYDVSSEQPVLVHAA